MGLDFDGNGKVEFADLLKFLTQKIFGVALWMLLAIAGGGYFFFFTNSGKRSRRKLFR